MYILSKVVHEVSLERADIQCINRAKTYNVSIELRQEASTDRSRKTRKVWIHSYRRRL